VRPVAGRSRGAAPDRPVEDEASVSIRQGRSLSRRYSLIAAASGLPLLLVILVLVVFQFTSQRQQLLRELEDDVVGHNVLLGAVIKSVQDYTLALHSWTDLHLGEPPGGDLVATGQEIAWRPQDARLLLRGPGALREGGGGETALAVSVVPQMRIAHRTMPYLRWSYWLSAEEDLAVIYPLHDGHGLGGRLGGASTGEMLDLLFAQEMFAKAQPAANPGRTPFWTSAYFDPGGAGWVVAHARPVDRDGSFVGVVATAVLLDFLTGFVRAFDYPCGRMWLVNDQHQVLAGIGNHSVLGLELMGLRDVLPASLGELPPERVLTPGQGFRSLNGTYVLSRVVGSTPWRLLLVVEPHELRAVLLPRFVPYGIILAGLLLTLLLAQQLRRRLIVAPALSLLEFIRAESEDRHPPKPRLPRMWRPWLDAVAEAFAAKRASLRQIEDSAENFRIVAESHPVPVAIVRFEDGAILHASHAFAELFGVPPDAAHRFRSTQFYVDPAERARLLHELQTRGRVDGFEVRARRFDGSEFPASLTSEVIDYGGSRAIISGILDLTEKKRAEAELARQREALRESERRFRRIAEAHPVPICIARFDDRTILHISQAFADMFGVSLEEARGLDTTRFYADPGDRDRLGEMLRAHGRVDGFEFVGRRTDGTTFPAALASQLIEFEDQVAIVSGVVDLTSRKQAEAELERQREALFQSEKLNALGSLLANVAHELNNPLSVVVGYATMMRDLAPDAATRERAVRIHAAAERCARIVRTFLAMARRKPASPGPVDLDAVVEAALEVAGYGLRTADIAVSLEIEPDLPPLIADLDQLTLVAMNLIVNAQHALQLTPPPRRLEITTRREGDMLCLAVADNGPGIPDEIAARIFEPFFTTKPQGVGTGIGLSVCRNVVAAYGGTIELDRPAGGGSRFVVRLPLPEAAPRPPAAGGAEESGPEVRLAGRILIVEDEVEVADVLGEMLARDGHEILRAESGREALARLAEGEVDLILCDLHMPDLDGPALYHELLGCHPECTRRMMFMTGDVLGADMAGFLGEAGLPVLDKPLDPYEVRIRVRARLAELAGAGC
jgi:PAS domain S-box-containing protein